MAEGFIRWKMVRANVYSKEKPAEGDWTGAREPTYRSLSVAAPDQGDPGLLRPIHFLVIFIVSMGHNSLVVPAQS